MPDFKCVGCRVRLRTHGGDAVREPCPICKTPLELVGELSEVVGFRAVGSPVEGLPAERFADRVSYLSDRREAQLEELRVAAQRWLDHGGSFDPGAVEPPPLWSEH